MKEKEIYFHVGTGKTGTTFLQYRVFPYFKGIHYIQRTRYKRAITEITAGTDDKYLVSREFDQQLEKEVRKFSEKISAVHPIIVFRRHDSYIASQYRRFVKNGYRGSFNAFFDLKSDHGYFKIRDLNYRRQIGILEDCFDYPPVIMLYEDLRNNPGDFVQRLADCLKAEIDIDSINFNRKHTSYSEKQLKAVLAAGRIVNLRKRRIFKNGFFNLFGRLYLSLMRYSILYMARLLPESLFDDDALIPPEALSEVRASFEADWAYVVERARNI